LALAHGTFIAELVDYFKSAFGDGGEAGCTARGVMDLESVLYYVHS